MKYAVHLILFLLSAAVTAGCIVGGTYAWLLRGGAIHEAAAASSAVLVARPALPAATAVPMPFSLPAALPAALAGNGRLSAAVLLLRTARCARAGARLAGTLGGDRQAPAGRGPPGGR